MRLEWKWIDVENMIDRYAIIIVVIFAFILRFYALEVPSMWGDELFAPVIASKPLDYLLKWVFAEDVHPPLFYFFLKLNLLMGDSDFALRLIPACVGTFSVWLCYKLGSAWLGRRAGILSSAILAVSASHIYISRVVRLYSITACLTILCLLVLHRFIERGERRDLFWLCVTSSLLLWCEYTSLIPIFALMTCAVVSMFFQGDRKRNLLYFARSVALLFAIPTVFLVLTAMHRTGFAGNVTSMEVVHNVIRALRWAQFGTLKHSVFSNGVIGVGVLFFVLYVIGAWGLWRRERRLLCVCASFLASPFLVLLVIKPGYSLAFWHLFYLYPIFALLAASGIQTILSRRSLHAPVATGLCLLFTVFYLWPGRGLFYSPDSYKADFKAVARYAASSLDPGSATVLDPGILDSLNWYIDRFAYQNRLVDQEVEPGRDMMVVNLLMMDGVLGHIVGIDSQIPAWANVIDTKRFDSSSLTRVSVQRTPMTDLALTGDSVIMNADPPLFYGSVFSAKDVMINPYWGRTVIPTKNNSWGTIRYRFRPTEDAARSLVNILVQYKNKGKGNIFKITYAFDGEEQNTLFVSDKHEKETVNISSDEPFNQRIFSIRREKQFRQLDVEISLYCSTLTPRFPTSNLDLVGFHRLEVNARPLGYDLMDMKTIDPLYELEGINKPERDGKDVWRWGVGPKQTIRFNSDSTRRMKLVYAINNPFNGQSYVLTVNGKQVALASELPRQQWLRDQTEGEVVFEAVKGQNVVEFAFGKINHVNDSFSDTDSTPYVTAFTRLRLEPVKAD